MKPVLITDPFTGLDFEAVELADGSILARNALTNEEIKLTYNIQCKRYLLDKSALNHIETVTLAQAAKFSNVSIQRISKLCADGVLQAHELPNGSKVILLDDLKRYNANKKNGRPRKEGQC